MIMQGPSVIEPPPALDCGGRMSTSAPPLNVLMVTDHLGHANGVIHGASRYYLQVLPRIDRARFNITLCILGNHHPFADELDRVGVRPVFLGRSKWDGRSMTDLQRMIREHEVGLLHCLAMKGCLLGRIAGRMSGVPAIIHLHDTGDPGAVIGFMQRRVARWTARALAVSDVVSRFAHDELGVARGRIETLYNGLDLSAFASPEPGARERLRREFRFDENDFVLLLAGRIVESKGQRLMITLMPRLLAHRPRLRLLVAGDGPDLIACRDLARDLGIERRVRFIGQRRDMPEVIAAADGAVMPSLVEEGFGFTALEAAAGGKPVAAFSGGAIGEIVEDGRTGFVAVRGDVDGLAEGVLRMTRDVRAAAEMGRAGALRAARFGIDRHVARLEAVYEEVAGAGAGARGGRL